ncbi:AIR synthase-related protein [Abyssalbus ytuae]|uniref:AIR synthase-related protein n=1 Tax=Abyssalbus ytuae TaxID=2926907 RepID=A0A9E7CTZ0_9FLAO|nr:AIR synthase-related protein [Abyssalbus ytuae]UOB17172.1 AIR synthase-related protein [Abyssalbus ytuae]
MSAFKDNSGKISASTFKETLFPKCGYKRKEVLTGPEFGVDTAVIDIGNNMAMAVSSDPLSLIPSLGLQESAWLSVHLLANDMATTGFAPMYAQFVLNLPASLSLPDFEEYWAYIHQYCKDIGVAITGGHTCQIEGQNSTVSGGGTMFLTAPKGQIITSNGAQPGDLIVVTKETALVSSSILAMSFPETVKKELGKESLETAIENFYHTSSLHDALCAAHVLQPNSELKAMHDVTEGGIIGAICEVARASDCGFKIYDELIPIGEVQKQITRFFKIDHRYSVGAGSMIMIIKKGSEDKLVNHLADKNVKATLVGKMTTKNKGYRIIEEDEEKVIDFNGTDPYWEAFFSAYKKGLK